MASGRRDLARVIVVGAAGFLEEVDRQLDGLAAIRGFAGGSAVPPEAPADLIVLEAPPDVERVVERLRRERPTTDLLVVGEEPVESARKAEGLSGVLDCVRPSDARGALQARVSRLLEQRRLASENQRMRALLRTVEKCRPLIGCFDAGKVYSLVLDLLLDASSRSRGFSVFQRSAIPLGDASAFRGLSEAESRRLREIFTDEKPLDLEGCRAIERVDRGPVHDALRAVGLEAGTLLAVPLAGEDAEAGVVWLFEDGREIDDVELERIEVIAGYAEAALRNCERYTQAKERAFVDDVTEVYNARYLLSTAENEIRRAERYETPLSVLFLDLDRFKLVNDRFGHLVGSQTLRKLSQLLLQCVRQVDTLARYGGDEFTILLVDTDHEEALAVARRIRQTVEEHVFEASRDATLRVTISIGVATYPQDGTTRDGLLDAADKAMYRAKSQGRNQVCAARDL